MMFGICFVKTVLVNFLHARNILHHARWTVCKSYVRLPRLTTRIKNDNYDDDNNVKKIVPRKMCQTISQ